jgi:carboxymethylenebutenolidase
MQKSSKVTLLIILILIVGVGIWVFSSDTDTASDGDMTNGTSTAITTYFRDHSDALAGTTTDYYPDNADVSGYLSVPEDASQSNQQPGIILVHEWWGLNEDIKQMADDYADEGFVALAVDMYGQPPTSSSTVARQRSQRVRNNMDAAMNNLGSAVDYLENRSDVDNAKLATVGWCFGGGWAYQMAINDIGVDASVMYYGQFDPQDDFENMRASILGHFGEEDSVVDVDNAREFKAELENADQSSAVYIYPNVGHSFANYQGGDNLAYDPQAAETAWNRTLNFLENRLNQTEPETESAQTQNGATTTTAADNSVGPPEPSADTTIRYTEDGFTPSEVTVAVGDTVLFFNESGQSMWVASDEHPTHEAYDGTSLQEHCGQQNRDVFDQCGAGDTYSFTFDKAGEWSFHNHERASDGGTVTVQ